MSNLEEDFEEERRKSSLFASDGSESSSSSVVGFNFLAFSAKGNVFSAGSLSMFASGGVINSPIAFPMFGGRAGIAGESGPEAILPLMRTAGGDLGVNANIGSRTVVNILTPPGAVTSEERKVEGGVESINIFIDDAVAGNVRPGTKTFKALQENFGLSVETISREGGNKT
ncbi:MAG: phage tail tape measure protein [Candidatus Hydrogenedentes bacterium]|nr:phage tail tape measure protein [Candidatus Hydrogenedentota bacterium]